MKKKCFEFLESKIVAGSLTFLIFLSVVSFSLETLPGISVGFMRVLGYSEIVIVLIFTAEYGLRTYSSPNRLRFVTSFHGIIDLLAIIPFYLAFAVDLRSLRLLRMFRLIRILKLVRYNAAISRMSQAFAQSKEELIISMVTLLLTIYLAAYGIFQFEHAAQPDKFVTIIDALWWAVVTVTTVGYGDVYPITIAGRLLTFIVLIVSLGLVAVPTGIFASALFSVRGELAPPESNKGNDEITRTGLTHPPSTDA